MDNDIIESRQKSKEEVRVVRAEVTRESWAIIARLQPGMKAKGRSLRIEIIFPGIPGINL